MTVKLLSTTGLNSLCSTEQLKLLDVIDSLRSEGVSSYLSLPQIIVCGDQSSGKSSVLEAISGVPFPVKSSVCTRFPTELILRKAVAEAITVSIVPHHSRNEDDKQSLSGFRQELDSFAELPQLVENAKLAMGILTTAKSFSEDILRIEISGPERPHLTIVDLPGLIHSENKNQSASDIELINNVVKRYMTEPRSVILAVVSAKNDYANQVVLGLARRADPQGKRTLGVITKPDTLIPGSGNESQFVSLAKNCDVEFRLGWHVLRNRDTDIEAWTLTERDEQEMQFFSTGSWTSIPAAQLGIKTLRDRLSNLLVRQIATELPNLMDEIETMSKDCQSQLLKLGHPRDTIHQQRIYLIQISQASQSLVHSAVEGNYGDPYFGESMSTIGYQKRIRALVQNLNQDFAQDLNRRGQRYNIVLDSDTKALKSNNTMPRSRYIEKIMTMIDRDRGRELPGLFNPMIVSDLFREQSLPWKTIAEDHIKSVWSAVRLSMTHLIAHVADLITVNIVLQEIVYPSLDKILLELSDKLSGLLASHHRGHPITYNHYFTETLKKIRHERRTRQSTTAIRKLFGEELEDNKDFFNHRSSISLTQLLNSLMDEEGRDMNELAASEALDCVTAYYKVAMKRFIDDVAVEVIETCLVSKLTGILSPLSVSLMADSEISRVASETKETRAIREQLKTKLRILGKGGDTCKAFASLRANEPSDIDEYAEATDKGKLKEVPMDSDGHDDDVISACNSRPISEPDDELKVDERADDLWKLRDDPHEPEQEIEDVFVFGTSRSKKDKKKKKGKLTSDLDWGF